VTKFKYAIRNGDKVLGLLWEHDALGKVLVTDGKIDSNFDLEIKDQNGNTVDYIDLRKFLLEILPTE
jgi:hypothetical protein